ncbi:MAG: recombinase RecT [Acidimicrobiales bacterium]
MSGSTDLAVRDSAALAIQPGQVSWDGMQLAALGQLGLKGAPDGDLAVFLHVSQRTGLDPFARQIYMIKRREKVPNTRDQYTDKWSIQTGIDGFRVNRSRAERLAGVRGILGRPVFYDHEGTEYKAWVQRGNPAACEITYTVRDGNGETPYTSILRFEEYAQTGKGENGQRYLTGQWATKGAHMLEKCTEADVYRKAFPQDFSGVQLDDAMPVPDPDDTAPVQPQRERVTAAQARQHVTATVETVTPEPSPAATETGTSESRPTASPPAEEAAAGEADHGPAPDDPEYRRAMRAAQAQLKRFVAGDTEEELSEAKRILAARILKVEVITSMSELTVAELRKVSNTLGDITGPDSVQKLEQLLTAGEVPGGQ